MHIILGTDTWGRTPHVNAMARSLAEIASVTVVDPYDSTNQQFASEEEAHARYLDVGGPDYFASCIGSALEESTEPTCLVGFSVGASAVWSTVSADNAGAARWALCFYDPAIRNMIELEPKTQVELIFASNEKQFDVEVVARDLQDKQNVQCYVTPFSHGFMNSAYDHFNQDVYEFWVDWIKKQFIAACA